MSRLPAQAGEAAGDPGRPAPGPPHPQDRVGPIPAGVDQASAVAPTNSSIAPGNPERVPSHRVPSTSGSQSPVDLMAEARRARSRFKRWAAQQEEAGLIDPKFRPGKAKINRRVRRALAAVAGKELTAIAQERNALVEAKQAAAIAGGEDPQVAALVQPQSQYRKEYAAVAFTLAMGGASDFEIATALGVGRQAFRNWVVTYPEFRAAVSRGTQAIVDQAERSLAERATGYTYESEKVFYDSKVGQVVRVPILEHVPPDVAAAQFLLKNKRPKEWRDKSEEVHKHLKVEVVRFEWEAAPVVPQLRKTVGSYEERMQEAGARPGLPSPRELDEALETEPQSELQEALSEIDEQMARAERLRAGEKPEADWDEEDPEALPPGPGSYPQGAGAAEKRAVRKPIEGEVILRGERAPGEDDEDWAPARDLPPDVDPFREIS